MLYQLPMRLSDLRELILNKFNYNGKEGHTVDIYPAGGTYTIVTNAEKQGVDVLFFDRDGRQLTDETRVFQVTLPDYLHSTYVFPLRGSGRALDLEVTDLLMVTFPVIVRFRSIPLCGSVSGRFSSVTPD